ncbi:tail fiber protein [Marinomonas phage P12026]|uniref:tail fiber protein n=1 Tax=Marinomonas phage P12026 TaxID=1176423 RepID=UPI0002688F3C|nr:tail fiber protein [Marinomonas phage P12026]AFM54864.1 hypothetical protein P12026_18 [Marinomonas phage P12026]
MSNTTIGREPIQIFEIEQPSCSNTYGVSPCAAAGTSKCFNTRATCQDTPNYNHDASIFWRFTHASSNVVIDTYEQDGAITKTPAIPSLVSVSTVPTKINAGGASDDLSVLGRRASVKITLGDHQHDDSFADKYVDERPYNAFDSGTFWGKWIRRNPYYSAMKCRVYEGYVGETLDQMITKTYVVDAIDGANSQGKVSITAKDPLSLADDKRAIMPQTSDLELFAAINQSKTTGIILTGAELDLSQEMGNTGANKYIRIDDEIILYTGYTVSTEQYTLTGVVRGQLGTTGASHSADESAQRVIHYDTMYSWLIAKDAILNYSTVPSAYIDASAWDVEGNLWLTPFQFTGTIAEPTPVVDILEELTRDSMFYIWWDERTQLIEMRALSPVSGDTPAINNESNILKDSFSLSAKPDERVSRVIIYYNQKNPTANDDEISNYSNVRITVDGEAESEFLFNEVRSSSIFSRWMVSESQALQIGTRRLAAFAETPEYMRITMDAKDRSLWTADVVSVTVPQIQDEFGQAESGLWQIIAVEEIQYGDKIRYDLRRFTFQINRPAYWTADDQVTYDLASDTDKDDLNAWWSDGNGLMLNGDDAYRWS